MPKGIDVNRGVTIRKHPTGILVYMYKHEPGVFLNAFGKKVSRQMAAQAGFDTVVLTREKERRDRLSEAEKQIDKEMAFVREDEEVVLYRRGEYRALSRPLGRAVVYDEENNLLTAKPIPEQEAKRLLELLVPGEDEDEDKWAVMEGGKPVEADKGGPAEGGETAPKLKSMKEKSDGRKT